MKNLEKTNDRRQWHICSNCFICDEDLTMAMQYMTTESLKYIIHVAEQLIKVREGK